MTIHSKILYTLRSAAIWLLILVSLILAQPLLGMASHAPDGMNRQLGFNAPDFGAELLNCPVDHSGNAKQSLQRSESALIVTLLVQAGLLPSDRPDCLRMVIPSPWLAKCHPLFLPRPPPNS